jgi:hypothetical protein
MAEAHVLLVEYCSSSSRYSGVGEQLQNEGVQHALRQPALLTIDLRESSENHFGRIFHLQKYSGRKSQRSYTQPD